MGIGGELEPIKEHQDEVLKSHQKISFGKIYPEGTPRKGSGRSSTRNSGRGTSNVPESLMMRYTKEF
jgi:hypothetical protein